MTGQLKKHSILESVVNVIVGFSINYCANILIFPYFGFHITPKQNISIGIIYTIISIVRSYALRRIFNRIMLKKGIGKP